MNMPQGAGDTTVSQSITPAEPELICLYNDDSTSSWLVGGYCEDEMT